MNPKKNGGQNELANPPKTPQKPGARQAPKKVNSCTAAESDLCPVCGWHLDLVPMHEKCRQSTYLAEVGLSYGTELAREAGAEPYTDTHDGDTEPNATPWPEEPQA